MAEVESVTNRMGEPEAMAPAEEPSGAAMVPGQAAVESSAGGCGDCAGNTESVTVAVPPVAPQPHGDPWADVLQTGVRLLSALRGAGDTGTAAHPWLERDPATGARSLRVPLPPPQSVRRLADALAVLADALQDMHAGE
jgi:hypothetical protein